MDAIISHNDLLISIDIAQNVLDSCEDSLHTIKVFFNKQTLKNTPSGSKGVRSYVDADNIHGGVSDLLRYDKLEELLDEQRRLENMKFLQQEIIKRLNETKKEIEDRLDKLDALEGKVYSRRVKGMTLEEIAEEMGYSISYIEKVSAQIKKHILSQRTY